MIPPTPVDVGHIQITAADVIGSSSLIVAYDTKVWIARNWFFLTLGCSGRAIWIELGRTGPSC